MEPLEWQGAQIPVYRKWIPVKRRVGNGDVYLVGDAAAQVKVTPSAASSPDFVAPSALLNRFCAMAQAANFALCAVNSTRTG